MALLLGNFDADTTLDSSAYMSLHHDWDNPERGLRGERNGKWFPFKRDSGHSVKRLQEQLQSIGFYQKGKVDGLYGYRTCSAVRLFQEYVLTIEGRPEIGGIDGIVGRKVQAQIDRWVTSRIRPDWQGTEAEYTASLSELDALRDRFLKSDLEELRLLNQEAAGSSSRTVAETSFDRQHMHIIGIRRNINKIELSAKGSKIRRNDDIFLLLLGGMRWVFRGSTNPSPSMAGRDDQAFLIRGQHEYRFGWHKLSSLGKAPKDVNVYRALKPRVAKGPLVVRSIQDQVTQASFRHAQPNNAINVHWSGSGTLNWSAGCQVIAGMKYLNFRNDLVDLTGRAASGYSDLSSKKTRGAYNVFMDLLTEHANDASHNGDTILMTLVYEEDVRKTSSGAAIDFDDLIRRLS